MNNIGCALYIALLMIVAFFATLSTIPESGMVGFGLAALIGYAIYALIIKPIIEGLNEANTPTREQTTVRHSTYSGKTSKEDDDILDVAIVAGLTHRMLSDNDRNNDSDKDIFDDKDDWDNDDMYYMYNDDHGFDAFDDFGGGGWDDNW